MAILRSLFWILLTAMFAFLFVVLFEHGTTNYVENAKKDFIELKTNIYDNTKNPKK